MCSLQTPGVTLLNTGSYNTDWWWSEAVKSFCLPIHIMIQVVWFNLLWYRKQSDCFRPVFSVFTLMCLLLPVSEDVTLEWKSQMAEDRLQHQTNHSHQSLHVNYSLKIDTVSQKKRFSYNPSREDFWHTSVKDTTANSSDSGLLQMTDKRTSTNSYWISAHQIPSLLFERNADVSCHFQLLHV